MSGRNTFQDLTKNFTPERRARVDARKAKLRATMPLHELRQARALTQKAIGEALNVNQPAVAKLERRTDMYVSKLRSYIEAMGGKLNIVAQFPQGDVAITNFSDMNDDQSSRTLASTPGKPVRKGTSGKPTKGQKAEIETLAGLVDTEIDTSDIPEIVDWSGARRGQLHRP